MFVSGVEFSVEFCDSLNVIFSGRGKQRETNQPTECALSWWLEPFGL